MIWNEFEEKKVEEEDIVPISTGGVVRQEDAISILPKQRHDCSLDEEVSSATANEEDESSVGDVQIDDFLELALEEDSSEDSELVPWPSCEEQTTSGSSSKPEDIMEALPPVSDATVVVSPSGRKVKFKGVIDDSEPPMIQGMKSTSRVNSAELYARLEKTQQALTDAQIDLSGEKAMRKRKEKNLLHLAQELNRRTAEADFKDAIIEKVCLYVNFLSYFARRPSHFHCLHSSAKRSSCYPKT
jgi:hypothetical protein